VCLLLHATFHITVTAVIMKGISVHRHTNLGPNLGPCAWISCLSRICPVIWRSTFLPPLHMYSTSLFVCLPVSRSLGPFKSLSPPYCKNINNDLTKAYHCLTHDWINWGLKILLYVLYTASALSFASSLVPQYKVALHYDTSNPYIIALPFMEGKQDSS